MGLNLESTISLNSATFERGMHRVKDSVTDGIKNFAMAAIGVGTVEEAFRRTIETAKELVNSSKQLNMTVEQVQLLRQAAKDAGKEFDTVAAAIMKIDIARAKALGGDKKSMAAFGALGVSRQDLLTKTGADLFTGGISNTVKGTNIEQIAAPLREVLGRGASESVAILKTDFDELGKKMAETGAIMDGKVAAQLKSIADEFELISRIIISQLAPALLRFATWAYEIALGGGGKIAKGAAYIGSLYATANSGMSAKESRAEASRVANDAEKPWLEKIKTFQKMLADAAKSAENPKPDFNKTKDVSVKMAEHQEKMRAPSDSLIKVGNFLGSSRGVINNAQAMLVQHAAATATNTKKSADDLTAIKDLLPQIFQALINSSGSSTIWSGGN